MNWKELIQYSSVQLRKLDANGVPCGIGSGCLIDFKQRRLLLTVFHVAEKSSNWCAQIKFNDEKQQTEVLFLNKFCYISDFDSSKKSIKDVEFSFHPVRHDFKCYFHNRNWKGQTFEKDLYCEPMILAIQIKKQFTVFQVKSCPSLFQSKMLL